jgi:hypothetical protein
MLTTNLKLRQQNIFSGRGSFSHCNLEIYSTLAILQKSNTYTGQLPNIAHRYVGVECMYFWSSSEQGFFNQ